MRGKMILAAIAVLFCFMSLGIKVSASQVDSPEETAGTPSEPPEIQADMGEFVDPDTEGPVDFNVVEQEDLGSAPFTPPGTGTVTDNADDKDGKEFYTVTTADEHTFYLVIDRVRGTENVYFLNAVTATDLMALAEKQDSEFSTYEVPNTVSPTNPVGENFEDEMETETKETSTEYPKGNNGFLIVLIVLVALGGIAGWYFKVFLPNKRSPREQEEYEPDYEKEDIDLDWEEGGEDEE